MSLSGQAKAWQALHGVGLANSSTGATLSSGGLGNGGPAVQDTGSAARAAAATEAQTTDRLIRAGGPFPYPKI